MMSLNGMVYWETDQNSVVYSANSWRGYAGCLWLLRKVERLRRLRSQNLRMWRHRPWFSLKVLFKVAEPTFVSVIGSIFFSPLIYLCKTWAKVQYRFSASSKMLASCKGLLTSSRARENSLAILSLWRDVWRNSSNASSVTMLRLLSSGDWVRRDSLDSKQSSWIKAIVYMPDSNYIGLVPYQY